MEREDWLQHIRQMTEAIYDYVSPEYWVNFGFYENQAHIEYLKQFLAALPRAGSILSAACGAGRYDGMLLDAGFRVVGIDQSAGMLARAHERFPAIRYEQIALQDMDFHGEFVGAICMDAMEHISPEDWPGIMRRFHAALQRGGLLYFTVEEADAEALQASYEQAKSMGLPVVFGELADGVQARYDQVKGLRSAGIPGQPVSAEVYHYYPSPDQVRLWLDGAGLVLQEHGTGSGYHHFMACRPG